MITMLAQKQTLFLNSFKNLTKTTSRTYYYQPFSYDNRYLGGFDYHDHNRYPRRFPLLKEEELLGEIHDIKNLIVSNPSPFHVVTRIKSIAGQRWDFKVTLRRLNLHSSFNGETVIVPNTPQFNALLLKVKHLIHLKPAILPNGRIPSKDDIGAIKIDAFTGKIVIDEKLRLQKDRLNIEKPPLFQGNFLRAKLNRQCGITHPHYLK